MSKTANDAVRKDTLLQFQKKATYFQFDKVAYFQFDKVVTQICI